MDLIQDIEKSRTLWLFCFLEEKKRITQIIALQNVYRQGTCILNLNYNEVTVPELFNVSVLCFLLFFFFIRVMKNVPC